MPRPEQITAIRLSSLGGPIEGADVEVTGITATSSHVRPGDLFAAVPGRTTHGARFAADAVAAGAVAVLTDAAGRPEVPGGVPVLVVANVRAALGPAAAAVYGMPSRSMRTLGVTGTSGKTTTAYFLRAGLDAAERRSGLIGTVATLIGDETVKTGFTTPEAPDVEALLAVMRERGVTDVAMEVSSHALELGRVGGIRFDVGGFSNLSQDHLDFHADMAAYFRAKARLFDQAERAVVVADDEWGARMADAVSSSVPVATVRTLAGDAATWQASNIESLSDGTIRFALRGPGVDVRAGVAIPGRFNVTNAALAIAMLSDVGVDPQAAADAIAVAQVPGRMERIDAGQPFLAVVDYSHKPAAVEGALAALRPLTTGRLIVVLGCGGDRDHAKRPVMGAIAARGAGLLIVTDDNPRSEDPAHIRREMLAGVETVPPDDRGEVLEIGDRTEAIAAAVRAARAGDTVLVAGKGHEPGQEIAGVIHPFDDREVLREALHGARA
ncbi:MAG: UDP-N-acetylmuramoyl-L-alanyl-D-glutamate--2,6-diaminopimelate ligase [Pseudonocardiales bacterium]|nr:UDP-N-acetylmuramoyl-L-alanyl-D-glutamate--2,6-diaminopimelate ligase [Pseudonocardiales bacterium]